MAARGIGEALVRSFVGKGSALSAFMTWTGLSKFTDDLVAIAGGSRQRTRSMVALTRVEAELGLIDLLFLMWVELPARCVTRAVASER